MPAQEIDPHCRQVIVDQHRWINTWSNKVWLMPHVHGDLTHQVSDGTEPGTGLPTHGSFAERTAEINDMDLSTEQ